MSDWQRVSLASGPLALARQSLHTRASPLSRALSSAPAPPASTPGPTPPPVGPAAGPSKAAIPRSFRPSLLALAPTFLFTHVTIAWALVPPVYFVLRSSNLSNTLLAGPQGAWFLSRKVPSWMPDALVDGLVGGVPADKAAPRVDQRPTVEELIERLARRAIRIVWNVGSSAYTGLKGGAGEEDALARAAMRELRGGMGVEKGEVKEKAEGVKDRLLGYTRQQAQGAVSDIQFGQIRDGVAAWVLVKILFPLRLPVSLFLTPRVARGLAKLFRK